MNSQSSPHEQFAIEVVRRLRAAGFVAYFAGGCVRDRLLSLKPKDYDVATDAKPEEVRQVFGKRRTIAIGLSFGVITVLGPRKVSPIEVATFRSDGPYSDGRHPDSVSYSTPEQDATRRDFTINGMFYDPIQEEVIDYVDGQIDLDRRRIRAIGDPLERIAEDRLRMLRAVRFAATYDFDVEANTLAAVRQQSAAIVQVSQERITNELQRMLCHANRSRALDLLAQTQLLESVLPHLVELADDLDAWRVTRQQLAQLVAPSLGLVLAMLHSVEPFALDDEKLNAECRRLKVSNETRSVCRWVAVHGNVLAGARDLPFSRLQPLLTHDHCEQALAMLDAVQSTDPDPKLEASLRRCRDLLARPAEQLDPSPLVGGNDLSRAGIPAGPAYKAILQSIRDAQLDGEISTPDEAIARAIELAGKLR